MNMSQMTDTDIMNEIRDYVNDAIAARQTTDPAWVTGAVIKKHPDIEGRDLDFYTCCAWEHVRDLVRSVVGEYKDKPGETSAQFRLAGFDHLQKAYLIERKGRQLIVPTELASDGELTLKSKEYKKMSEACASHADEIIRYVNIRRAANNN